MRLYLPAMIAAILLGCGCPGSDIVIGQISYDSDYFPDTWSHPYIVWRVGHNLEGNATVELEATGDLRTVKVIYNGETIEEEKYEVTSTAITFNQWFRDSEVFEPGIPLLKFPSEASAEWTWEGTHRFEDRALRATATISTDVERIQLATGSPETVAVTVRLTTSDDSEMGIEREFKIWFEPGVGPVKRDFGYGQVREPRLPEEGEGE